MDICPFARPARSATRILALDGGHGGGGDSQPGGGLDDDLVERILLQHLVVEALAVGAVPPAEKCTTLAILPPVRYGSFERYMAFVGKARPLVAAAIAAAAAAAVSPAGSGAAVSPVTLIPFHPKTTYARGVRHDPALYVSRSPHPTVHLLRESDVALAEVALEAAGSGPAAVSARNEALLRGMGAAEVVARWARCFLGEG